MVKFLRHVFLITLIVFGFLLMDEKIVRAKAYFAPKSQMIVNSEIIALVDIKNVESAEAKGMNWTYSRKAIADPVKVLKGNFPKGGTIYGGENFICASCPLQSGKALVFLGHDNDLLIGTNWQLSIRPVVDEKLDWYKGEHYSPLEKTDVKVVIEEIEAQLAPDRKLISQLTGPLKELSTVNELADSQSNQSRHRTKGWAAYTKALALASSHKAELSAIFKNGTPAGRIYAAMLIYHADKAAGKEALGTLLTCKGSVSYQDGCMLTPVAICQVAADLNGKGSFKELALDGK